MKKKYYIQPQVDVVYMDAEELLKEPGASFVDDGHGGTHPVNPGDPSGDIEIGAKPWFGGEEAETSAWD